MLRGIDVSHWEGQVDWAAVCAAGYKFAYTKATERNNYFDDTFNHNVAGAHAVGIPIGAYHFFRLDTPAKVQADYFLSQIKNVKLDLPPALDFEEVAQVNQGIVQTALKTWLDIVEQSTGRKPIIYTGLFYWEGSVGNPAWAKDYQLWLAQYTSAPTPHLPNGWTDWLFWQYTDKGTVPGCQGNVDLNLTGLSEADLDKLAGMAFHGEETIIGDSQGAQPVKPTSLEDRIASLEQEIAALAKLLKGKSIL